MKPLSLSTITGESCNLRSLLLFIFFTVLCFNQETSAQTSQNSHGAKVDSALRNWGSEGHFILKGKVTKTKSKFFEFVITNYIENTEHSVILAEDGSFEQRFPVVNSQQIYLYLNDDVLTFTVSNRDTLVAEWEEGNFRKSFKIGSPELKRDALLQTELELYNNFRQPFLALLKDLNKNKYSADEKFELINAQYNRKIKTIINAEKKYPAFEKMLISPFVDLVVGEYFLYADMLRTNKLLHKPLEVVQDSSFKLPGREILFKGKKRFVGRFPTLHNKDAFKISNEHYLTNVPAYRTFLFNYVRFYNSMNAYSNLVGYKLGDVIPSANFTELAYYQAKASFSVFGAKLMEDWFITKSIANGFNSDEFHHVEKVYKNFLEECRTPFFKDILRRNYESAKNLKPGLPAPDFVLKDENGKDVSLADFKGKVVYIDFWGVLCGPCILEFEEYTPKLHQAYKDKNVIFLNICVDSNEKDWKQAMKRYKVKGVNLIAEGWGKNSVCQTYNVSIIPHYILINKDGTIADYNAPRPSEKFGISVSESIDKALVKP